MKNYIVTVNGVSYEVSVEEVEESQSAVQAAVKTVSAAAAKPAAAPAKKVSSGAGGAVKVSAPMPGKIITVKKSSGASVKKGEVILILEAMKMENEIVAPQDGVIASVDVAAGDAVEAGDILATMN